VIDLISALTSILFLFWCSFLNRDPTQINVYSVNATATPIVTVWTMHDENAETGKILLKGSKFSPKVFFIMLVVFKEAASATSTSIKVIFPSNGMMRAAGLSPLQFENFYS